MTDAAAQQAAEPVAGVQETQQAVQPTGAQESSQTSAQEGEQAQQQTQQERDDAGRFRNPVQPRIDQLTREKGDAQRERDYWKNVAMASQAPAPAPDPKPVPEDFQDYAAFVEALADWKADQKVEAALSKHEAGRKAQETAQTRANTWEGRQAEARKGIADYDAVLEASSLPLADHVGEALLDSDLGPRVAYHLAKNPELLDRLNRMTPVAAAREVGRIEASISNQAQAAPSQAPAQQASQQAPAQPAARATSAPAPAKTALPSGGSAQVDLGKLSMEDYVKARQQQGASWARR